MNEGLPNVARVIMPEHGVFLVCLPEGFDSPRGTRCVVQLDYGEDVAEVRWSGCYDPEIHGSRIPGFKLIRPVDAEDAARTAANASLADSMTVTFSKLASADGHNLKIVHKRLSFGRDRLFIRFVSDEVRPDLSRPCSEIKRLFNATVNAWQLGPRDEVSLSGALGPCGRACCCCDWLSRYPQGLNADRIRAMGMAPGGQNGMCGRFRCCLAFEDGECTDCLKTKG